LFLAQVITAEEDMPGFSLSRDYQCQVNPVVPDAAFFDQVHDDSGYADDNPDVQSNMTGMDSEAALLANRTDCEADSELNFDALLLGGYFCHKCLPEQDLTCDFGGVCSNVQWNGYVCDNEFLVQMNDGGLFELQDSNETTLDPNMLELKRGVTYRFTVLGEATMCATLSGYSSALGCAKKGPLLLTVIDEMANSVAFTFDGGRNSTFELLVNGSVMGTTDPSHSGLSTGVIVGIVIGSILFLVIIALVAKMILQSNNENKPEQDSENSSNDPLP